MIAVSDNYEITLLDNEGKIAGIIKRDVTPERIKKRERDFFDEDIESISIQRGWPKNAIRKILKIIPQEKTFFDRILLNTRYVFVFRIKNDVTLEESPTSVDVFSNEENFLGTTTVDNKPVFISEKFMYFIKSDEEGNMFIIRRISAQLKK
ncbi:MAG: hypothetical protein PVI66_11895 [Candidatus Aminicenantes bacterium]